MGKRVGLSDASVRSGGPARYKAEAGRQDIIHILDETVEYYTHQSGPDGKLFFPCSKDGDAGTCPACDARIPRVKKWGNTVALIASKRGSGFVADGSILLWTFGADKYVKLRDLNAQLDGAIRKVDLVVTCEDTQFQRVTIIPRMQGGKTVNGMTREVLAAFREQKDALDAFTSLTPDEVSRKMAGDDASFDPGAIEAGAGAPPKGRGSSAPAESDSLEDDLDKALGL